MQLLPPFQIKSIAQKLMLHQVWKAASVRESDLIYTRLEVGEKSARRSIIFELRTSQSVTAKEVPHFALHVGGDNTLHKAATGRPTGIEDPLKRISVW
jgi:hypothetical protein